MLFYFSKNNKKKETKKNEYPGGIHSNDSEQPEVINQ